MLHLELQRIMDHVRNYDRLWPAGIEPTTICHIPPYIGKFANLETRIVSPGAATPSTQAIHDFACGFTSREPQKGVGGAATFKFSGWPLEHPVSRCWKGHTVGG